MKDEGTECVTLMSASVVTEKILKAFPQAQTGSVSGDDLQLICEELSMLEVESANQYLPMILLSFISAERNREFENSLRLLANWLIGDVDTEDINWIEKAAGEEAAAALRSENKFLQQQKQVQFAEYTKVQADAIRNWLELMIKTSQNSFTRRDLSLAEEYWRTRS
jgi:hypothetical protein